VFMSATVLLHNGISEDKSRKLQMQLMMEKLRSKALQSQYKPLTDSIKNIKLALLVSCQIVIKYLCLIAFYISNVYLKIFVLKSSPILQEWGPGGNFILCPSPVYIFNPVFN